MAVDDRLVKSITLLKDLRPGMKNVTCAFIVIDKGTTSHTKDGSVVRKCQVADRSASISFSLWNEQAAAVEGGDILRLTKGYVSLWKGSMVLYSGKYGKLEKIGEFTMVYSETPNMSDLNLDFTRDQQPSNNTGGGGRVVTDRLSSTPNGRMGSGLQSVSGNWNGNNHLSEGSLFQQHQSVLPPPLMGHVIHNPGNNGGESNIPPSLPQKLPLVGQYTPLNNSGDNHRTLHRYHGNHSSERYSPYQQRPQVSADPRLGWR